MQEAYVRLCQVEDPADIRTPHSYLFKTARNLALDFVKRSETRLSDSLEELLDGQLPQVERSTDATFEEVANDEEFSQFCDAVRHLPLQCRRAFVLKKVYGYSQKEIAREMGISENTVEKHVALGLRRCLHYMQRRSGQPQRQTARATRSAGPSRVRAVSLKEPGA